MRRGGIVRSLRAVLIGGLSGISRGLLGWLDAMAKVDFVMFAKPGMHCETTYLQWCFWVSRTFGSKDCMEMLSVFNLDALTTFGLLVEIWAAIGDDRL